MHSAFEQFAAFSRDAVDNRAFVANGKLTMPVLAIGAEKSFGTAMADEVRFVAVDVTCVVIANSGHWLMEEQPAATVAAIAGFLRRAARAGHWQRRQMRVHARPAARLPVQALSTEIWFDAGSRPFEE